MSISEGPAVPRLAGATARRDGLQLFMGIVAVVIGIAAFVWPLATIHVIGFLFGVNLIVTGFIRAGLLLFMPAYPPLYRVLGIAFGVLTGIVGILCLYNIAGSVLLLVAVVAVGWLLDGLVELFMAVGNPAGTRVGWRFGTALAMILGAIAVLVWPKIGLAAFITIGATVLILVGIGHLVSAITGRRSTRL
jgi:uncharacterized membrane protein HdeD (DUF308 family)